MLVAEGPQARPQTLDDRPQAGQPRPGSDVGHGGRTECSQIAQDYLARLVVRFDASTYPLLDRAQRHGSTLAPDASRWYVDQRQQAAHGIRQRRGVALRPPGAEKRAKLGIGPWLFVQQ